VNIIKLSFQFLALLFFESIVLSILCTLSILILEADRNFSLLGFLATSSMFFFYKVVLEIWVLLLVFGSNLIKLKLAHKGYLFKRFVSSIVLILVLIALLFDVPRGMNFIYLLPILYPVAIYITYRYFKDTLIAFWFEYDVNKITSK